MDPPAAAAAAAQVSSPPTAPPATLTPPAHPPPPGSVAGSSHRHSIFSRSLLRERVKITPREIGSNIRAVILAKLQLMLEGVCTRHGYVRPGSLRIQDLSHGRIEGSSLNGDIIYNASVLVDVCNPAQYQVYPARVVNSNKFGLLAHSGIEVNGKFVTILETIVTRHSYTGPSDVPVDSVRVGDDVFVEVLGKTFELQGNKIMVAGRLLRAAAAGSKRQPLLSTALMTVNDSDDEGAAAVAAVSDDDSSSASDVGPRVEEEEEEEEAEDEDEDAVDAEEDDEDAEQEEEDEYGAESDVSGAAEDDDPADGDPDDDEFSLTADDDDLSEAAVPATNGGRKRGS